MEGRVPSGTHGVSSTSDPGRSGCAPALLTSYVLKSNAPVHRQLAGVKFRLSSPSDEAKGPLNGPAGDRLDRSSIAVSGEVCPDSQDSDRGEGRGEDSASAAIAPDRSTTTSPEDLAAAARRVPVERAPLPDVKTRSALACGEPTATALAAASRRGNVEAENSTPVTGGMAGQVRAERLLERKQSPSLFECNKMFFTLDNRNAHVKASEVHARFFQEIDRTVYCKCEPDN